MVKTLKYNILERSHDPDLFMRGDLIGCQAPSGKSTPERGEASFDCRADICG